MEDLVERLIREAQNLSVACMCNKKGCGSCRRRKLLWEAKREIEELRKHLESI